MALRFSARNGSGPHRVDARLRPRLFVGRDAPAAKMWGCDALCRVDFTRMKPRASVDRPAAAGHIGAAAPVTTRQASNAKGCPCCRTDPIAVNPCRPARACHRRAVNTGGPVTVLERRFAFGFTGLARSVRSKPCLGWSNSARRGSDRTFSSVGCWIASRKEPMLDSAGLATRDPGQTALSTVLAALVSLVQAGMGVSGAVGQPPAAGRRMPAEAVLLRWQ